MDKNNICWSGPVNYLLTKLIKGGFSGLDPTHKISANVNSQNDIPSLHNNLSWASQ